MKKILVLSLLTLSLVSCKKVDVNNLGSSDSVPCSSTSYGTGIRPLDAVGRNGEIILLMNNCDTYSPWVRRLTQDGGTDSEGFPRLKEHDKKSIRGHISDTDNPDTKPVLSRWGQRLVAFFPLRSKAIECYELKCSEESYSISSHKINNIEVVVPGMSKAKFNAISVTEFHGRMYAVAECDNDGGDLVLLRTTSEDSSIESFEWEFVEYVKAASNHIFDITTVLVPMPDGSIDEVLYLGMLDGSYLRIYRYNENGSWTEYSTYTGLVFWDGMGCFKLEVGEFKNSGQDNSQVVIQAIISIDDKVRSSSFYPATSTFGDMVALKNHNGSMSVASASTPRAGNTTSDVPASYQQHIYVLQGENSLSEKFDIDRYTSGIIESTVTGSALLTGSTKTQFLQSAQAEQTIESYLADPDSRKTCALIGIVEGPPPTFVRDQNDFDALLPTVPSVLRLSTGKTEGNSESYNYTLGVCGEITGSSIDFRKLKAFKGFSIGLGIDISGTTYNDKTLTKTVKLDRVFNSTLEAHNSAVLLYSIPLYSLYDYYYCNSKGERLYSMSVTSHLTNDEVIIYAKPVDISSAPFNVSDPMDLTNWKNRFSSTVTSGSRKSMSLTYTFGPASSDVSKSFEKTVEENRGWTVREQANLDVEVLYKLVDVKAGVYGDFTQSQSHKCSLSDEMQMSYYQMDESIVKGNYGIKSYQSTLHMMFENCEDSQRYYKQLIDDKLMLPDEHPWILGYQISNIDSSR